MKSDSWRKNAQNYITILLSKVLKSNKKVLKSNNLKVMRRRIKLIWSIKAFVRILLKTEWMFNNPKMKMEKGLKNKFMKIRTKRKCKKTTKKIKSPTRFKRLIRFRKIFNLRSHRMCKNHQFQRLLKKEIASNIFKKHFHMKKIFMESDMVQYPKNISKPEKIKSFFQKTLFS